MVDKVDDKLTQAVMVDKVDDKLTQAVMVDKVDDKLTLAEKEQLYALLLDYSDIFALSSDDFGRTAQD